MNNNDSSEDLVEKYGTYDPQLDLSSYRHPTLELLPESQRLWLSNVKTSYRNFELPLLLGTAPSIIVRDLYHHPNLLLAGTIASGKTQFIYNQIISWLYVFHPAELKFIICRSKSVDYNSIAKIERHFLSKLPGAEPAIAESGQVAKTINALLIECDQRLDLFTTAGVKTIKDYNNLFIHRKLNPADGHRFLSNIVLIMDDMQTFLDGDVTSSLISLTQRNLYTGIYFIAATSQIMSRSITPQLRANFSVRLAMRLMSQNESRKILDRVGAEKLNPPGELIFEQGDRLLTVKQPFVDYDVIQNVCDFVGSQRGYPNAYLLPITNVEEAIFFSDFDIYDRDPLFEESARLIVMHQQGSTSLIQRKLKLGYNRAGRIMDQLEGAGIVGSFEGSKAREVFYADEYALEQYLETINASNSLKLSNFTPPDNILHNGNSKIDKIVEQPEKLVQPESGKENIVIKSPIDSYHNGNDSRKAQLAIAIFILAIMLIIYLISGWEGVVNWLK
ncbi:MULTISPECIES: DNA translocase FtsK [Sphingobacterium]|uniref:DNA translocase FtsK n=1 Tax=Sphingobacterium populi TaxID=1812824 RepID=A0ABW5U8U9_9SPHI|nr:DNA translocase FtsK [Sphingobacterium sp. CFCC 11742]